MEDIGNIIKERRNTLSITQLELAELAGVAHGENMKKLDISIKIILRKI